MLHKNQVGETLFGLDLASIRARILQKEGWSTERLQVAEEGYRVFLTETTLHPEGSFSPATEDVDVFWHYHILDTQKYAKDCEHFFGGFLHHVPSSEESNEALKVTCDSRRPSGVTCYRWRKVATCDSRLSKSGQAEASQQDTSSV